MTYIRGELDLTVTGPEEDIHQVAGWLQAQKYENEKDARLRDWFLMEWVYALTKAVTGENGQIIVRRRSGCDPMNIPLQLIERMGNEFPRLQFVCRASALSDFDLIKTGDTWEGDCVLFDMAKSEVVL